MFSCYRNRQMWTVNERLASLYYVPEYSTMVGWQCMGIRIMPAFWNQLWSFIESLCLGERYDLDLFFQAEITTSIVELSRGRVLEDPPADWIWGICFLLMPNELWEFWVFFVLGVAEWFYVVPVAWFEIGSGKANVGFLRGWGCDVSGIDYASL